MVIIKTPTPVHKNSVEIQPNNKYKDDVYNFMIYMCRTVLKQIGFFQFIFSHVSWKLLFKVSPWTLLGEANIVIQVGLQLNS